MAGSRKISVEITGDAGDFERSIAGALVALKAFGDGADKSGKNTNFFSKSAKDGERSLYDFDKAASKVNKTMSGGPFGLFDAIGNVGYGLLKLGGFAQSGGDALTKLESSGSGAEASMSGLGQALAAMGPLVGILAGGFVTFGAALLVLPALIGAVTFVLVALLDVMTTLAAVVVSLIGPLGILAGLLGGLGAAFFLSGQRALKGGGIFKDFGAKVEKVTGQFHDLIYTLAGRFLPLFDRLASGASIALHYFNQLAHMPLNEAFKSLATQGVAMLSKAIYGIANELKRPFRLAVQIAFGAAGSNANQAIANWWNSITRFLFGYQKSHPINIGLGLGGQRIETTHVAGALQPIIDFLNSQKFVDTGVRWSNEIIDGLRGNKHFMKAISQIASHAGHVAGDAFNAALVAEIKLVFSHGPIDHAAAQLIARLYNAFAAWAQRTSVRINNYLSNAFHGMIGAAASAASAAGNAIKDAVGGALNWIRAKAASVWDAIRGFFSNAFSLHFHIPGFGGIDAGPVHIPGWGGVTVATGGVITGGMAGRDSVPALLTPGEIVLNREQQLSLLRGGPRGDIYITLDLGEGITRRLKIDAARTARAVQAGSVWS